MVTQAALMTTFSYITQYNLSSRDIQLVDTSDQRTPSENGDLSSPC